MFNFGLFTSHLPYIAIVVAYVFYFLTSFFNNEKFEADSNTESTTLIQNIDFQSATNDSKAYIFIAKKVIEVLKTPDVWPKLYFVIKLVVLISPRKFDSEDIKILSSLFFRPPPSIQ